MGLMVRFLVVALSLGAAVLIQNYRLIARHIPIPDVNLQQYWGPGNAADYKESAAIKPFDITTKPEIIEDLRAQLKRPLKLHEPLEGIKFQYGFNAKQLEKLVIYWRDTYLDNWATREKYLKQFPHFQTQIQGLNIHFIHIKPKITNKKKVLPLLLIHGWPGSIREFYDIIPLLTTPNEKSDYVFEVIAPSLPGYAWSQGALKVGLGPSAIAVIFRNLMLRLGHNKFVIQGGDWGSIIGSSLTALFPENVIAYHSNMCTNQSPSGMIKMIISRLFPSYFVEKVFSDFYRPLSGEFAYAVEELGYMHLQASKPDTIGIALSQNPVGLAAYILEKFSTWTNSGYKNSSDGGLGIRFTADSLLDNVMIYYVTNSITTSQRLYAEAFAKQEKSLEIDRIAIRTPVGCARFLHDLMHFTDFQLRDRFLNLVHSTYFVDGGHFAAMELPETLYYDFVKFIKVAVKN